MNRKIILTISGVAVLMIGGLWFSKTMAFKNFANDVRSQTNGIDRVVEVYSYGGEKIAEYEGEIFVKDGDGGTVSITLKNKKVMFSNVSVIIEEK